MNELSVFDGEIPFSPHVALAKDAPKQTGYTKSIRLVSKGALVDNRKCQSGDFCIVDGDSVTVLGQEIDVIPLALLHKALDTSGEEAVVAYGDDTDEYQRIAAASANKEDGNMHGPCYLVYERTQGDCFELYLCNASGRREEDNINAYLPVGIEQAENFGLTARGPQRMTLKAKFCQSKKNKSWTWFAPQASDCNSVFENLPAPAVFIETVNKFLAQAEFETDDHER